MYQHRVLVGIVHFEEACHSLALGIVLSQGRPWVGAVFFAQVPGQRQMVPEASDKFVVVELAQGAGIALIEQELVFGFLGYHMQHNAFGLHMVEYPFPLFQFAYIKAGKVGRGSIHPHIMAIALNVKGKKVDRIHSFRGQVVNGTNNILAFLSLPGGIALRPLVMVGLVTVEAFGSYNFV